MLVFGALLSFVRRTTGIYFETNDDRYIASILSGVITGSPDAHVIYVNYLLALPLSWLYRLTAAVPWYGGMLVLLQWTAYGAVLDSAWTRCRGWFSLLSVTAVAAGFFVAFYYLTGLLQYTSTAALLAMAGYACLLLRRNRKSGFVWFMVFELLGCLLRSQAMLMLQPLGLAAVLAAVWQDRRVDSGEKIKGILTVEAGVIAILCLEAAGNFLGYQGAGWDRYERFNDTRTLLFDYYGKPGYEEVSDILEEGHVSREQYEAYCSYLILDWRADEDCEKRLGAYAAERGETPLEAGRLLGQIRDARRSVSWKVRDVILAAWGIFLLWMLFSGKLRMLLGGTALLSLAGTAVWGYLVWKGRTPLRVTLPLLACEVLLLLALVWREYDSAPPAAGEGQGAQILDLRAGLRALCAARGAGLWRKVLLLFGCACFCGAGISSGRLQCRYVKEMNQGQQIFMEGLREIQAYCGEHPGNRYLLDANSLSSYKGSAFETSVYQSFNAVLGGGWFSTGPAVQRRLEEYLGTGQGFYFLIYADGGQEDTPQFAYLVREMGGEPELADRWRASHGGDYAVYYFEGAFPFSAE